MLARHLLSFPEKFSKCGIRHIRTWVSIIKNLVDSTILLSNKIYHVDNLNIIKEYLILNNYPTKFIDKYIKKITIEIYNENNTTLNKTNPVLETKKIISISFYGKISENVKRIIAKQNINIIFRVDSKLNKIIKLGKDVLEKSEVSNVVYKLECISCDKTYLGQTKRLLNIRREEHKNNFNLKNKKYHNVIAKRRTENRREDEVPHDFDRNNIQILYKENNLYKRLFAEMINIKKVKESILNKITYTDSYSNAYNVIIDFIE